MLTHAARTAHAKGSALPDVAAHFHIRRGSSRGARFARGAAAIRGSGPDNVWQALLRTSRCAHG